MHYMKDANEVRTDLFPVVTSWDFCLSIYQKSVSHASIAILFSIYSQSVELFPGSDDVCFSFDFQVLAALLTNQLSLWTHLCHAQIGACFSEQEVQRLLLF